MIPLRCPKIEVLGVNRKINMTKIKGEYFALISTINRMLIVFSLFFPKEKYQNAFSTKVTKHNIFSQKNCMLFACFGGKF